MPRKQESKKPRILFVDKKNDFTSQVAEYYAKKFYGDRYEIYSAGPEHDFVDCELISVMYREGEDMRRQISKDFRDQENLPEDGEFDIVVYLQSGVFEEWASKTPWQGKQILCDFGIVSDFRATDDLELFSCYSDLVVKVRKWVEDNLSDYEKLKSTVCA